MKRILCAVNLDGDCTSVAERARELALMSGASVKAVYALHLQDVVSDLDAPTGKTAASMRSAISGAEAAMSRFLSQNFTSVATEGSVVLGCAASEILAIADHDQPDMIVVGTHKHGAFGFDTSVAENVARGSHCPVLMV